MPIAGVALQVSVLVVLGVGGFRVASGALSIASLIAFIILLFKLYDPVRKFAFFYNAFQQAMGAGSSIFTFFDADDDVKERPHAVTLKRFQKSIHFKSVGFSYSTEEGEHQILHDIDLEVHAGEVLALVGPSGAGKSTLVDMLFGLRQPTNGTITIDGIKLDDANIDAWRTRTSACFQDHLRLELAARESVGAGDLPRIHDDAAIRRALAQADADTLVPDLDMLLGLRLGGTELSGGEWQRIANARANMRSHPLLLALDEPTSALDALAERAAFDRYAAAARTLNGDAGTITVMVSHRLASVRNADLIVVLDQGSVIEYGSHDELIRAGNGYAELYDLQARHYR